MKIKAYRGLCVSAGKAKGVALNCDPNTIPEEVEEDTIIVVKRLERDLVVNLSSKVVGVVAEVGNIGSHGAGILRQLKIPCILRIDSATRLFKDGETIEIDGTRGVVVASPKVDIANTIFSDTELLMKYPIKYRDITSDTFSYSDIRINDFWLKPRPDRVYQRLRYEMIADVYAAGTSYLYHVDTLTRYSDDGCIEVYGIPTIESICAFQLCNPDWFVKRAKERTSLFNKMKQDLHLLSHNYRPDSIEYVVDVYKQSYTMYRDLFKYMFLTQLHSDQFIELYLDFIQNITGQHEPAGVLDLKSKYVKNCIQTQCDPGVFKKWDNTVAKPHIWEGKIDFDPLPYDERIVNFIRSCSNNKVRLQRDYNSFRVIVPLMYQLSEEFFYMSKSINSFLNWSMQVLCNYMTEVMNLNFYDMKSFYDLPLTTVNKYISQIMNGGH